MSEQQQRSETPDGPSETPDGPSETPDGPRLTRKARLEAFSDGVFAIAITLLVLDLYIPSSSVSSRDLLDALYDQWPGYLGYIASFLTIGALWLGHNAFSNYLERADATVLRLNLVLLLFVALLPFSTQLVSDYVTEKGAERTASVLYGMTLLAAVALLSWLWRYAVRAGLVQTRVTDREIYLLSHRLLPALVLYGLFIIAAVWAPLAALIGYLGISLFFVVPVRIPGGLLRHASERLMIRGPGQGRGS